MGSFLSCDWTFLKLILHCAWRSQGPILSSFALGDYSQVTIQNENNIYPEVS